MSEESIISIARTGIWAVAFLMSVYMIVPSLNLLAQRSLPPRPVAGNASRPGQASRNGTGGAVPPAALRSVSFNRSRTVA